MPGAIPHLIAGCTMFFIGRYFFKNYFDGKDKLKERLLLAGVCLSFSFLPDFFLIIYYLTGIFPKENFVIFHDLFSLILLPIAIVGLIILKYIVNTKRGPIWIMGCFCILLHITMDFFIEETGVWF